MAVSASAGIAQHNMARLMSAGTSSTDVADGNLDSSHCVTAYGEAARLPLVATGQYRSVRYLRQLGSFLQQSMKLLRRSAQ